MERSALLGATAVSAVAWLLAATGSAVAAVTAVVAAIGLGPAYPEATRKVAVIVRLWPALTVPSAHGNAEVHAPALARKVRPAGVGSRTWAPSAASGPWFVTTIV